MKNPSSTYRLQLSPEFTFSHLEKIIDYLDDLGISTVYAAPFFQARPGSTHGYDVTDPFTINSEIGDLEQFRNISKQLKERNMTWLQDIVPNHMAFDGENVWLRDIFELGPDSRFYRFFDIDWEYKGWGKVMAPFLGDSLEEVLENSEIKLKIDKRGISVSYFDHSYPASARSYAEIIPENDSFGWKEKFRGFSGDNAQWERLKMSFCRELDQETEFGERFRKELEQINASGERLKKILDLQYFLFTHWKQTEKEINYRRFFTINDLICLRMEDQEVFDAYHYYIKELCEAGMINGLRIDHIDGLFDPEAYVQKLRKLLGEDFYIVVEKILELDEKLPTRWDVQGTSGYDFLAEANLLFTCAEKEKEFSENYKRISPEYADYEKLVYEKKLFILKQRMAGELSNLLKLQEDLELFPADASNRNDREDALSAFLAAFPVYRIYPHKFPLNRKQQEIINTAWSEAVKFCPEREKDLNFLKQIFLGEADRDEKNMLYYLQRCQQFSGPLAAKGGEDTSFYIYNRLISHNEVGDSPDNFGVSAKEFHQKMLQHKRNFPRAINATATHDTKRGEDARMRLNVLSEIPEEWFDKVEEWKSLNSDIRKKEGVPGNNEEYFIYQTLVAAMPFDGNEQPEFLSRTKAYLQKVLREAKVHSNWAEPDEDYEQGVFDFLKDILEFKAFRDSLDEFRKKVNAWGVVKSLGQSLVKSTVPGVPDVYQGTELWDLSYVDPDNRRPVDYELRKKYLTDFKGFKEGYLNDQIKPITDAYSDARVKMFCLYKALQQHKANPGIFETGDYIPLEITGKASGDFAAFARRKDSDWVISLVPVQVTGFFPEKTIMADREKLKQASVTFPEGAPDQWINVFTGQRLEASGNLTLDSLLGDFPVCLLKNKK